MKREILFRGKRIDNDEWIYGWLIQHENLKYYILWYDSLTFRWKKNEVIEETIGQFTGLTDKNGIKIFEDDIDITGDTIDSNSLAMYVLIAIANEPDGIVSNYLNKLNETLEIIGNIHDNPELL